MTLKKLLLILFSVLLVFSAILAGFSVFVWIGGTENVESSRRLFHQATLAEELQIHLLRSNRELVLYKSNGRQVHLEGQEKNAQKAFEIVLELKKLAVNQEILSKISVTQNSVEAFMSIQQHLSQEPATPAESYEKLNPNLRQAHQGAESVTKAGLEKARAIQNALQEGTSDLALMAVLNLIVAALYTPIAWRLVSLRIYRPVTELKKRIEGFRRGKNFDVPKGGKGVKELEEVLKVFNELSDRLKNQREIRQQFISAVSHDL